MTKPVSLVMAPEHHEGLRLLWGATEGLGDVPNPEALARFLSRNPGFSRVILEGDKVVAALLASFDGMRGYFYRLAVDRSCRHRGLASILVADATGLLRKAGADRINLHVFESNGVGLDFWRKMGWERYPDLCMMRKKISP